MFSLTNIRTLTEQAPAYSRRYAGDGDCLWVVGDSRQSIYRFRGASSSNMAAFASDYYGAISDQLSVNYRSTQQIVDALLALAPRMGASTGMLPLDRYRRARGWACSPEVRQYDTLDDEARRRGRKRPRA